MKIEQQNLDIACALATCVAAPIYLGHRRFVLYPTKSPTITVGFKNKFSVV
jgi:hypothetical protein